MDLQSRKTEFVQDFLKLQSEEAISRLEKLLKKEKKNVIGKYPVGKVHLFSPFDKF